MPFKLLHIRQYCKLHCEVGKLPRVSQSIKYPWKNTNWIRHNFIEYFQKFDHKFIEPCSVHDKNDGSYFVNSGVSQFKEHILGRSAYFDTVTRAVNSQRCIRLGGKKCDLENIGYDSTHLSYFEMLGNWSFRAYNKMEVCTRMWHYLTEILGLQASHLYVTYFGGCEELGLKPDDETRDIWFNLGVKDSKILQFGVKDNFWEMGDRINNTLCGPSTEIHWDYLATMNDSGNPRCARCFVNSTSPEVVELWNCVFMEYQWAGNGSKLVPLPGLVIDTGMGLERLASIIQGVTGVFDTDNFAKVIDHLSDLSGSQKYEGLFAFNVDTKISPNTDLGLDRIQSDLRRDVAYRVISDHLRALCICVHDGIQPGRQDVELKLRHLLHRAIRQSKYGLGMLGGLSPVIDTIYETLRGQIVTSGNLNNAVKNIIRQEEQLFLPKLEKYEETFENFLKLRQSDNLNINESEVHKLVSGDFGHSMSADMIRAFAKDYGLQVKDIIFNDSNDADPDNGNSHTITKTSFSLNELLANKNLTLTKKDAVYNYVFNEDSKLFEIPDVETEVMMIIHPSATNSTFFSEAESQYGLIASCTNMFPLGGGQDSDKGVLLTDGKIIANIVRVEELKSGHIIHWCEKINSSTEVPSLRSKIVLRVDHKHRTGTTLHHTAHHIVVNSIKKLVGKVHQSSSSVKPDHSRLGFTVDLAHGKSSILKQPDFIQKLENLCNETIREAIPIEIIENVDINTVLKDNTIQYLKTDKLPNRVRLITMGDSKEVCCGTHALNTSQLQDIAIISQKGTNQAISEIVFVTGAKAIDIRRREQEYTELHKRIHQTYFINNQEIEELIYKLNVAFSSELVSKSTRKLITESLTMLALQRNKPRSIAKIVEIEVAKSQKNNANMCIVQSDVTSMKKIIQTITQLKTACPIMIYNKTEVLIYLPEKLASEHIPSLLENIHQLPKVEISIPKVKNIDQHILDQYAVVTFSESLQDDDRLKGNFRIISDGICKK